MTNNIRYLARQDNLTQVQDYSLACSSLACENIRFSSARSSPMGTFRAEERLRLSGRNSILMTQTNVYIINPVVMGFQIQICPILRVFWSIWVKCCFHLPTCFSKTKMLLQGGGHWGGTQYRNAVRKNGKYRNTEWKIVQIPIPHTLITFIIDFAYLWPLPSSAFNYLRHLCASFVLFF